MLPLSLSAVQLSVVTPAPAVMSQQMQVQVPPGATSGQQLTIQAPSGQQVMIALPAGSQPGQFITVAVPAGAAVPAAAVPSTPAEGATVPDVAKLQAYGLENAATTHINYLRKLHLVGVSLAPMSQNTLAASTRTRHGRGTYSVTADKAWGTTRCCRLRVTQSSLRALKGT